MKNEENVNNQTQFTLRCSFKLREDAEKIAEERGQSLAEFLRRAVQKEVDRELGALNMGAPEPIKPAVIKPASSSVVPMSRDELERFIDARMRAHDATKKGPFGIRKVHYGSPSRQQCKLNDAAKRRALAVMKRSGTD